MNNQQLQVGIVGLGASGKYHINGFNKHPQAKVVAGVDVDPQLRQARSDEFGIKCYKTMGKMFDSHRIDIVSIVVPPFLHKELTIQAIEHGCHVMCEKPVGLNAEECLAMVGAAKKAQRLLGIHFTHCFTPQVAAMKKLTDSGELGEIYYAHVSFLRRRGFVKFGGWETQKKLSGGGAVSNIGIHQIAVALLLMDFPEPAWVSASTYNHIGRAKALQEGIKTFEVEDTGVALIRLKNGASLILETAWAANIRENSLITTRLLGAKAGLLQYKLNDTEAPLEIYSEKNGLPCDMILNTLPNDDTSHRDFIDSVLNKTPYLMTGEKGHAVMKIIDAIHKSAATGSPVEMQ